MLDIESPSTTRSKLKHLGTPPTNSLVRVDFLKENILLRFLVKPPCDLCCFVGGSKKPSGKKYAKVKLHHFANKNRGVKIFFWGKKRKKNTTCRPCFWISFPPPPWPVDPSNDPGGTPGPTKKWETITPPKNHNPTSWASTVGAWQVG